MISKKEREVYNTIKAYIEKNGFSPSMREICRSVGIQSTATITVYLDKLESLGYIHRGKFVSRGISIIK